MLVRLRLKLRQTSASGLLLLVIGGGVLRRMLQHFVHAADQPLRALEPLAGRGNRPSDRLHLLSFVRHDQILVPSLNSRIGARA